MQKLIHDLKTNEVIFVDLTPDELAEQAASNQEAAERQAAENARQQLLEARRAVVLRTRVSKAELADLPPRARTILEFLIDKIEHLELELALLRGENPTITPL